jgi:hypothetical protein
MRKPITLLKFFTVTVMLFLCVTVARSATITYSLTTHVDGRTITGSANLNSGASLLDNMPQTFWRAYCTYKFYSDAAMINEITAAPSSASTVYVDYVFEPPFIMSEEDGDPVWHNFRTYSQQADAYYLYVYSNTSSSTMEVLGYKGGLPSYGGMNDQMKKEGHAQWAFYGDAYDFHIKVNEDNIGWGNNVWLVPYSSVNRVRLGARKSLGWQLLVNKASNKKISGTMMAMQDPDSGKFAELSNLSYCIGLSNLNSQNHYLTSKNELTSKNGSTNADRLWWYAFFATPVSEGSSTNLTTFVIKKAYDYKALRSYWYTKAPAASNTKVPEDLFIAPVSDFTYTFYQDEELTQPFTGYVSRFNSTIYVKESCPQSDHWVTMVLPFDVSDVTKYFGSKDDGETPAASVLEYTSVATTDQGNDVVNVDLTFSSTTTMAAHTPYLVKFDEVGTVWLDKMENDKTAANASEDDLVEVTFSDTSVPSALVSMKGTYEGFTLLPQSSTNDPAYFYFGYNSKYDPESDDYVEGSAEDGKGPYNFYIVRKKEATISPYRCYFYVTGTSGSTVSLSFMDNTSGIAESIFVTDLRARPVQGVFNLNGQRLRMQSVTDGLPAGIYVVNGKKVVVK